MKWKTLKRYLVIIPLFSGLMTPFYAPAVTLAYYPFASKKLEVAVTGSGGEVYDSNITLAKNGKKADLITELVGGLKAIYTGKRHLLDLLVEDKEEIYAKHSRYTNNSQNAQVNYQYERTQYDRFGLTGSMDHYYNPQDFEDAFGRTGGQYSYWTFQTDGSYTRDVSQRFSLTATVGGGINIIEKEAGTDSYNLRAGLSGYYKLSNKWGLLGGYDFAFREFDGGPHSTIHALTGGTRYYFTDRLFWDGIGGFQIVDNFSNDILVRPYIQTSLNGQLDKKTTAKILYSQRTETTSYSESVFDQWRTSLVLTRQLWGRLSANASAFYGQGKYKSRGTQDDYLGASGGLAYEINEHFKITANYTFTMQHSKPSSNDYNKTVASLRAVFNF